MCKKFLKFNLKNRSILNNTVFLTVLLYVIYSFTFILPHNLHCVINNEQSLCQQFHTNSFSNNELSNSEQNSENENKENEDQDQDLDDCPICNLTYFNSLYYTEPLICQILLIETNEKPVNNKLTGFSSFTFLKFFLRSPPSFVS